MNILFEERAGNTMTVIVHVGREGINNTSRINTTLRNSHRQVEKVAAFLALIKSAQLCTKQFVKLIGRYFAMAIEPTRCDSERNALESVNCKMFSDRKSVV